MFDSGPVTVSEPSFWARLPDRLTVFGVGLVTGTVVALIASVVLGASVAAAFGYTMVILGAVCLLGGGLTGGGYSVYGPGEGVARNHHMRGDGNKLAMDSLRAGYNRPRADPGAFWMAIGGFLYVAMGVFAIALGS